MNTLTVYLHIFAAYKKIQFKPCTPYAPRSNGLVENRNRQLNTFLCTVFDSQYNSWSHKINTFAFAFNSHVKTIVTLSPYEPGQNPKKPIMFNLSSTTDSFGNCKTSSNSPCNSFPQRTHNDH